MDSKLAQLSDADLRLLRVFKVVADCGGLSAAEGELNIGRSTISRHLKDLEIRLGLELCRRGRSGFSLTSEGEAVYQAAQRLMGAVQAFQAEVQGLNRELSGSLSLAFFDKTVSNPSAKLSEAIALFDQRAPKVELELHVDTLSGIESGVTEGRYHLGVVPSIKARSSLRYQALFDEQMQLYCGSKHPLFDLAGEDISSEQIIAQKYAGLGHHSPNLSTSQQQGFIRSATAYDQETIVHLLLSGRYLAYLPVHYAQSFVEQGLLRALGGAEFAYACQFSAVVRQAPAPSRLLNCFWQCLLQAHQVKL